MEGREDIRLRIIEPRGIPRQGLPVTRGVPLPEGTLRGLGSAGVADPEGRPVPAQFRTLSRWPDGSLKWVPADFQVDVPANGEAVYTFQYGGEEADVSPEA